METKSDIRNELFNRNEVIFSLESEKNPTFVEAKKMISEEIKKPEENVEVLNVYGNFGSKEFAIHSYVYDSVEDLKKAEQKTQKQRKAEVEASKKAEEEAKVAKETPAEEVKVEETAEAKPEEKPAEEAKKEVVEEKSAEKAKE